MKKLIASALVLVLALLCIPVSADIALPFELSAPANVSMVWLEENDSPTTMQFSFSIGNDICKFFSDLDAAIVDGDEAREALLAPVGVDEIWMFGQIDWAIDDPVNGWHYTQYWDGTPGYGVGYDEEGRLRTGPWDEIYCTVYPETVNNVWILRGVPNDFRWTGEDVMPGLRDQLQPGQYTYHDDNVYIDYDEHTAYARVRIGVTYRWGEDNEKTVFSDWSANASWGRDAEKFTPYTKADLKAPDVSGLRITDRVFNDNPVAAFALFVPDELAEMLTKLNAYGGNIVIETEGRVKGEGEWRDISGDWTIRSGELFADLLYLVDEGETIPDGTEIEVRCRYFMTQPNDAEEIYSDYSRIMTANTSEISQTPSVPVDSGVGHKCRVCGICPIQPLGICLFIWIAIIVLIVIVIIIIASRKKKKK